MTHHTSAAHEPGLARTDHDAYIEALPPVPQPTGNYVPVSQAGDLVFTAGHTHAVRGRLSAHGPVGSPHGPDLETARDCARLAVKNCLASLANHLGGLDRVEAIVQMTGYISAAPDFAAHPSILDGASQELVEAFGERGRPSRAAVGVTSLPDGAVVEVSLVAAVRPEPV